MSTLKAVNLQHPDAASPNVVLTSGGGSTFAGAVNFSSASVTGITSLPTQTGNSGKYLTTDGSNASWATVEAGLNPLLLMGA